MSAQAYQQQSNLNEQANVLSKAVIRVAEALELSRVELCAILGMSEASASRFFAGNRTITPNSKEGELALLLLRIYRSLSALVGDNDKKACLWLRNDNNYLKDLPIQLMQQVQGLVAVANYLDAIRGKV